MIVLDTNVISELMRPAPAGRVSQWANTVDVSELSTTAICQAEILYGLALMSAGRRQRELTEAAQIFFEARLEGRILSFDSAAAKSFATLRVRRSAMGKPMRELDAQIAAICIVHSAVLATRDCEDFDHLGVALINPWAD